MCLDKEKTLLPCCLPVSSFSRLSLRGVPKPSICRVSSLSFLFNNVSVNALMEAVLYSYMRLTSACSLSVLLQRERTLAKMTEGSSQCLHFSCLRLALITSLFFPFWLPSFCYEKSPLGWKSICIVFQSSRNGLLESRNLTTAENLLTM